MRSSPRPRVSLTWPLKSDARGLLLVLAVAGATTGCERLIGPAPEFTEVQYESVAAGANFSCGTATDGATYCWGSNREGTIGAGIWLPLLSVFHPVEVEGGHRFTQVATGWRHACGVTSAHEVFCWGANGQSQLGSSPERSPHTCRDAPCAVTPEAVATELRFKSVATGVSHTCGITVEGNVFCWGDNQFGQLGQSDSGITQSDPTRPNDLPQSTFVQVAAGHFHSCALTEEGDLYCWGRNEYGQVGSSEGERCPNQHPEEMCVPNPVHAAPDLDFTSVAIGGKHTCGLTPAQDVYCWGYNKHGQIGVPPDSTRPPCATGDQRQPCSGEPVRVASDVPFALLSAGSTHNCALTPSGEAFCWGNNDVGMLGDCSSRLSASSPRPVCGGHRFSQVAGGGMHSCAVTTTRSAYCWGNNDFGALGSSIFTAFGPVRVAPVQIQAH